MPDRNFPSDPAQVGAARRYVLSHLDPKDPRYRDAELLTSEVVTNAIRHAKRSKGGVDVAVNVTPAELAVTVTDGGGGGAPVVRPNPEEQRDGGRGMLILESVAYAWGSQPTASGGMQVWFVLRSPLAPNANYPHNGGVPGTSDPGVD